MRLAESRGALRRNLGGADSDWTDELLDGAVARAVEDLDRIMPQEKMAGFTIVFNIDDEVWNSGTLGTTITLANKRIRPKDEKVTNAAKTTTYSRDTDYTMDYAAGKITTITTGAIPADQADLLITYNILEVYLDISSYTDLIRVVRIEYPAGRVPSDFQSFFTWGDFAVITARGRESQQRMTENEHAWLYYHATHDLPEVDVDGSWKPQLDEVVIKGAESYGLMTKALELRHSSKSRLALALTALGQLDAIGIEVDTSLTAANSQASSSVNDLSDIDGYIASMLSSLAAVSGYLASAGDSLVSAVTQAEVVATDIAAIDTPLTSAGGRLSGATSIIDNAEVLLDNMKTFISTGQAPLNSANADLLVSLGLLEDSLGKLPAVESARLSSATDLEKAYVRISQANTQTLTEVDSKLSAMNPNIDNLITGVGDQLTLAGSNLVSGAATINAVNIGEQVSEMFRRYADVHLTAGRLRYDEHLTFLGRIDRILAQGAGMVSEAGELRAQADVWLNGGNLIIGQINAIMGQIRGYQENIAQYISVGQARINSGQVIATGASVSAGLAGRSVEQANSYVSIARVRLDAAEEDVRLVDAYLSSANAYVAMANAKIAEANAFRTPIDSVLERVTRRMEVARVYQQESDRRIQEVALKQQEADRYIGLAVGESELADKFEERGVLTKTEFMGILTDRAQVRSDTSLAPTRQQAPG